jgi:serine/threonine-protein kinase ULK/ATG1
MQSERVKSKKRVKHYEFLYDAQIGSGAYAHVFMGRDIYTDKST